MLFIDSGGLNISNRKLFALLAGLHSSCRYILIKSLKEDYDILLRLPCSSREYGHLKSFPVFQKKTLFCRSGLNCNVIFWQIFLKILWFIHVTQFLLKACYSIRKILLLLF